MSLLLHLRMYLTIKWKNLMDTIALRKTKQFTPFIILCEPRSGSTLLHTYLNSHLRIKSYGEILREQVEKDSNILKNKNIDELVFKPHTPLIKAVGLKVFYFYSEAEPYKEMFGQIVHRKEIKIIHLIRSNTLELFASLKRAQATNIWSSNKTTTNQSKINIDADEYQVFLAAYLHHRQSMNELFAHHQNLMVEYDDLVKNPQVVLDSIQQFLQVKPSHLFTLLKKQSVN